MGTLEPPLSTSIPPPFRASLATMTYLVLFHSSSGPSPSWSASNTSSSSYAPTMKERVERLPYTPFWQDMYASFCAYLVEIRLLTLCQANIARRDPREERSTKMERVEVLSLRTTSKLTRSFIEASAIAKTVLKVVGVFGVSLVMSGKFCSPVQSSVSW